MEATGRFRFEQQINPFAKVVTPKKIVVVAAMLMALALTGLGLTTAHGAPAGWSSDVSNAMQKARGLERPLVILISNQGCDHCATIESNLSHPTAQKALNGAIKVRAEASDNPDLVARYASRGTPTLVVFTPDTGFSAPVFTHTGVLGIPELRNLGRSL
jgi:thioredoxin-related protein